MIKGMLIKFGRKQTVQKGFTMIEVLVSLLILSVGVLGVAMLQITALKNNQSASYRTEATLISSDIVDKMRANRTVAISGGYDVGIGVLPSIGSSVVSQDLNAWKTRLAAALPTGDGAIQQSAVTNIFRITVQWDDSRATNGAAVETFIIDTQL